MDHIALLERPPEEVSAPSTGSRRSGRFTGMAVLAAIAAAVLGISALGGVAATQTTATDRTADGTVSQGTAPAAGSAGAAAGAQPVMAGGHGAMGQPAQGGPQQAAGQQAGAAHTVTMTGYKFVPQTITVAVGDTVTWVNNDTAGHTVTVTDGPEKFSSDLIATGKSFSHTFTKPGTYSYYCAVHPDMTASVVVQGAGGPPPAAGATPPGQGAAAQPPAASGSECVPSAAYGALMQHLQAAHLQESPGQQASDLLALDQYAKTHTVLVQNMLKPVFDGAPTDATAQSLNALWQHLQTAHLQESPGQQLTDLLSVDQYAKTHTALVQNMLAPHVKYTAC